MIQEMFTDHYDILEELGKGAFSIVKKCMKKTDKSLFAVKIINCSKLKERELLKLEKEARICRTLNHPNIVKLFDVYKESKFRYFVFELITGGELFDDIVARERYSEFDASYIAQQILESISYCHSQGIIHRDIKPENLLLASKERNANIKLVDFGLAVEIQGDQDIYHGFAGTPGYMSPEVVKKEPYGKKIDVWACGVILYILMVGYNPFWDENQNILYDMIKEEPLAFDPEDWKNLSNEVKVLVTRMMDKNPITRISAEEALNDPWIQNRSNVTSTLNRSETLQVLKSFNARRKLKGAILTTLLSNKLKKAALAFGSNCRGDKNSDSTGESPTNPKEDLNNLTMVNSDDIIQMTDQFIHSWISLDDRKLNELCDPAMTIFDSSIVGTQIIGFNMISFACQHGKMRPTSSAMIQPHVIFLGPDAASISLVRICQFADGSNILINQSQETYIWQRKHNSWRVVHIHRTFNTAQEKPRLFNI